MWSRKTHVLQSYIDSERQKHINSMVSILVNYQIQYTDKKKCRCSIKIYRMVALSFNRVMGLFSLIVHVLCKRKNIHYFLLKCWREKR